MVTVGQTTGMRGVYLVAAELSRNGLIASPTSRSARGADILVTDQKCTHAWSVQVKTNAKSHSFWLLNAYTAEMVSPTHIYVLVNLISRRAEETIEYFVVPSRSSPNDYDILRARTEHRSGGKFTVKLSPTTRTAGPSSTRIPPVNAARVLVEIMSGDFRPATIERRRRRQIE